MFEDAFNAETFDVDAVLDQLEKEPLVLRADLESVKSTIVSLNAIRIGEAGLNAHRQELLKRVPDISQYASFPINSIEIIDLAYLSAATQHEFALFRSKKEDILFHGDSGECNFPENLEFLLENHKCRLEAHSHPDYPDIIPSASDRALLRRIGQKESVIVSWYTGQSLTFSADMFEDLTKSQKEEK